MTKHIIETQSIILKVYVINFPIYIIKFSVNFKYRSRHRWGSLNKIFLKSLQNSRFSVNIANFKNIYFENHLRTVGSDSSYILHIEKLFRKSTGLPDWPFFLWKHKITLFYLLSLVFIPFITRCHLLSLIFGYSLSFVVIHCHLLYHSLSLDVTGCITRCHSLYYSMSFGVTRCHSL